ncbi:hypothetical protein IJ818_05135 [bacterium]|nr:hypothetical protein [bacterium]
MHKIIKQISLFILSMQEKILSFKLKGALGTTFTNSTSKTVLTKDYTVNFSSETEKNKQKLKDEVTLILKEFNNDVDKILGYIELEGTKVYNLKFAEKILKLIGEEKGFITAIDGFKAFVLNLILEKKISFKSEDIFVVEDKNVEPYSLIHQFHKWYAKKLNLPGFDKKSQKIFKKYLKNDKDVSKLKMEEIVSLKEAIARDTDAINFVVDLAKNSEGSKEALKKIVDGGAKI